MGWETDPTDLTDREIQEEMLTLQRKIEYKTRVFYNLLFFFSIIFGLRAGYILQQWMAGDIYDGGRAIEVFFFF